MFELLLFTRSIALKTGRHPQKTSACDQQENTFPVSDVTRVMRSRGEGDGEMEPQGGDTVINYGNAYGRLSRIRICAEIKMWGLKFARGAT
jgi:hypothetical protein